MSKWNRPMRRYTQVAASCGTCGEAIKPCPYGGWDHVKPLRIKDPAWHRATWGYAP